MLSERHNPPNRSDHYPAARTGSYLFPFLYSFAIAGYPLVAGLSTLIGLSNRVMSIGFRVGFLACSVVVILRIISNKQKVTGGWIWFPIATFWFVYLLRLSFDTYIDPIALSREAYEYWTLGIGGCLVPMCAFMARLNAGDSQRILSRTFAFVLISSSLVLLAFFDEVSRGLTLSLDIGRLSIGTLNPIGVGHLGGSLIILSTFMLFRDKGRKHKVVLGTIHLLSLALGIGLILSAGSRGAIVATLLAYVLLVGSKLGRRGAFGYVLLVVSFVMITNYVAIEIEVNTEFSPIARMFNPVESGSDAAIELRFQAYRGAWQQFVESPIIGSAIEERSTGTYPHNLILEAFMATGLIGGGAFLSLLIGAVSSAWKILRENSSFAWVAMLFLQYNFGSMFSGSLWASSTMWVLMAAVFSISYTENRVSRRLA